MSSAARSSSEPARPARRRYHVALTASEILERLAEQDGVKAYAQAEVPDFGGAIIEADYTLELGEGEFSIHVGPPAARGQSATGMHRLLYLRGRLRRTGEGTLIEIGFAQTLPPQAQGAADAWTPFEGSASAEAQQP